MAKTNHPAAKAPKNPESLSADFKKKWNFSFLVCNIP